MNDPLVRYVASDINGGTAICAQTNFEKEDSHALSLFQRIGLRYLLLDPLTALGAKFCNPAQFLFVMTLVEDGWPEPTATYLLAQAHWEDRMFATWFSIDKEDRMAAVSLNYEAFQNFWPNLDFTAGDFMDRARCWSNETVTNRVASGCDAVGSASH